MGLLTDLLSAIDARKRVLASNLRDPVGAMGLLGGTLADERRRSKRETEEAARRVKGGGGLLGMSVMGGDKVTDMPEWEAAGLAPMGLLGAIKAYHGSPHKFDKFSMEHIGKGEGAQAYGHGLYFAENPGVANDYAWNLSQRLPDRIKYDGKPLSPNTMLARAMEDVGLIGKQGAIQKIDDSIKFNEKYSPDTANMYRSIREIIDGIDPSKVSVNKGETYEVSLRWPDAREATDPLGPQHFLDWDKPLSQQPDGVRKAVSPLLPEAQTSFDPRWGELGAPFDPAREFTGQQIVSMLRGGESVVDDIIGGGGRAVSQKLRAAGIPGIRYLDAGSRGAGTGTANYVMFDDALIEILKRNGMAP